MSFDLTYTQARSQNLKRASNYYNNILAMRLGLKDSSDEDEAKNDKSVLLTPSVIDSINKSVASVFAPDMETSSNDSLLTLLTSTFKSDESLCDLASKKHKKRKKETKVDQYEKLIRKKHQEDSENDICDGRKKKRKKKSKEKETEIDTTSFDSAHTYNSHSYCNETSKLKDISDPPKGLLNGLQQKNVFDLDEDCLESTSSKRKKKHLRDQSNCDKGNRSEHKTVISDDSQKLDEIFVKPKEKVHREENDVIEPAKKKKKSKTTNSPTIITTESDLVVNGVKRKKKSKVKEAEESIIDDVDLLSSDETTKKKSKRKKKTIEDDNENTEESDNKGKEKTKKTKSEKRTSVESDISVLTETSEKSKKNKNKEINVEGYNENIEENDKINALSETPLVFKEETRKLMKSKKDKSRKSVEPVETNEESDISVVDEITSKKSKKKKKQKLSGVVSEVPSIFNGLMQMPKAKLKRKKIEASIVEDSNEKTRNETDDASQFAQSESVTEKNKCHEEIDSYIIENRTTLDALAEFDHSTILPDDKTKDARARNKSECSDVGSINLYDMVETVMNLKSADENRSDSSEEDERTRREILETEVYRNKQTTSFDITKIEYLECGLLDDDDLECSYSDIEELLEYKQAKEEDNLSSVKKLENLAVTIPFDVPVSHQLETRMTAALTRDQETRMKELGINFKSGPYKKAEDEKIVKNFEEFCKIHDMPNDKKLYLNITNLPSAERVKFVRFLGRSLDDRKLSSIYKRFKVLSADVKKGEFTANENKLIMKFMEKNQYRRNPFLTLSKILGRDKLAVHKHYQKILKTAVEIKSTKTDEELQRFLDVLLEVTSEDDIDKLKDRHVHIKEWTQISETIGIEPNKLKNTWLNTVHPRLFVKIKYDDLLKETLYRLDEMGVNDWKAVKWQEMADHYDGCNSQFLANLIRNVKKRADPLIQDDAKKCIQFLKNLDFTLREPKRISYKNGKLSLYNLV